MPDDQGEKKADKEDVVDSSLHAYKDGREEDIVKDQHQKGQPAEQRGDDAPEMGEENPEGGQTQEGGHRRIEHDDDTQSSE